MRTYIVRRLSLIIPTLFLATLIVFLLLRFIPGDALSLMLAESSSATGTGFDLGMLRHSLGLDAPIHIQYFRWLGSVLHGDLGVSLWSRIPVTGTILKSLPVSLELGAIGIVTALLISLPIGIYSAVRQDTVGDYLGRSLAIIFISVPSFWIGTAAIVFPAIWWRWMPPLEYVSFEKNAGQNLIQFLVPGIILGMVMCGSVMRMTRTMMLEVLRQDYIRTAWSKGIKEKTIVLRHAMKNAMLPVVTMIGMMIPVVVSGTVVLETIFALPGMGRLMVDSLNMRDYPIISGVNLILASFILMNNLLVDVTYAYLDPRIKYTKQ